MRALPQPIMPMPIMPMPVPASVVANAFVQQYFSVRHQTPAHISRFYGAPPSPPRTCVALVGLALTLRCRPPGTNSVAAWPSRFTPWPEAGPGTADGATPAPLLELNSGLAAIDVKARQPAGRLVGALPSRAERAARPKGFDPLTLLVFSPPPYPRPWRWATTR